MIVVWSVTILLLEIFSVEIMTPSCSDYLLCEVVRQKAPPNSSLNHLQKGTKSIRENQFTIQQRSLYNNINNFILCLI